MKKILIFAFILTFWVVISNAAEIYDKPTFDNSDIWYGLTKGDTQVVLDNQIKKLNEPSKISEEQLKSYETFIQTIKSNEWIQESQYPIVGGKCIEGGNMWLEINWNGYSNLVCRNSKVLSITYILKDRPVDFDTYMKEMYQIAKENVESSIKNNQANPLLIEQEPSYTIAVLIAVTFIFFCIIIWIFYYRYRKKLTLD